MGEKHKIFARNEDELRKSPHPVQSKLTSEQIDAIYRPAKTKVQRYADDRARQQYTLDHLPKFPTLKVAGLLGMLFAWALLFAFSLFDLWRTQSIALIFFSFLWFLSIGISYFLAHGYVAELLYRYGRSPKWFWSGMGVVATGTIVCVSLFQLTTATSGHAGIWLATLVHVFGVWVLGMIIFPRKPTSGHSL